jgi:hypothetical protein
MLNRSNRQLDLVERNLMPEPVVKLVVRADELPVRDGAGEARKAESEADSA